MRTLQLLAAGFGRAKARAEVYFEHARGTERSQAAIPLFS